MKEVIIIGGGASGMMAAIIAARKGVKVCVLERLNRIGKKILVTGNGRCNLSNTNLLPKHYHTSSSNCDISGVLNRFGYQETEKFFGELGIMPLIEGTKVYPLSEQATSILDVMRMELERLEVEIVTEVKIVAMTQHKAHWRLQAEDGTCYEAKKVIVATGGMTNTSLGCDGLGYRLLKDVGHSIAQPFPILVHVLSESPYCKMMKGTKVKAQVNLWIEGTLNRQEYGEVLFTEDGLSGPPIFQISRGASWASMMQKKAQVTLDLFPQQTEEELLSMLYERTYYHPERTIESLLIGMVHKRVIMPLLKASQIQSIHRRVDALEYEEIQALAHVLKAFTFEVNGTRGYKFAQVTAGGIKAHEIDFTTMASLKAPNLYITGEVMDIDGDCGGYNLQWAWATGYIAGESVSQSEDKND